MIEIFKDKAGEWRFTVKGKNGKIIVTSEGYVSKANAARGLATLKELIGDWANLAFHEEDED